MHYFILHVPARLFSWLVGKAKHYHINLTTFWCGWISALGFLVLQGGIFDQVGLQKNTAKTVIMVCQSCHAPVGMSEAAYTQRVTGKGPMYRERQRMRVDFPECEVEVTAGSFLTYCQSQHDMGQGDPPPGRPRLTGSPSQNTCLGWLSRRTKLQIHFSHSHVWDTIVILEEGSLPYSMCIQCNMFVTHKPLTEGT